MEKPKAETPPYVELYKIYRGQLDHENDNVNQKVIWHVISQSFFFGAYANLMNAPEKSKNLLFNSQQDYLVWVLPGVALLVALLILPSLIVSMKHISRLEDEFKKIPGDKPPFLPPIQKTPVLRLLALSTPLALPVLLAATWVVLLVHQVLQS